MLSAGLMALLTTAVVGAPVLRIDSSGHFLIQQVADVHYGEGEAEVWGPEQDLNSTRAMMRVLSYESPDLVAFTGDQITGNNIAANATDYWDELTGFARRAGVPHMAAIGNHDDLPFEAYVAVGSTTSRQVLMAHDATYPTSVSAVGPSTVVGAGNYFVPVYGQQSNVTEEAPVLLLYVLDSGGGTLDEDVDPSAVAWLNATVAANRQRWNRLVPALLFVHIPSPEFVEAFDALRCHGMNQNGGVTPTSKNTGLVEAAAAAGVVAVIVGHDHGNDWACPWVKGAGSGEGHDTELSALWLVFGRHSGYGGYGSWARGSRMYQFDAIAAAAGQCAVRSWVRLENGTVTDGITELCPASARAAFTQLPPMAIV